MMNSVIQAHGTVQQKILDFINTLPDNADISAPMCFHLSEKHKSVVNKALRKLCLKGIIEFDRSEPNSRGGQQMNIYKKVSLPMEDTFEFGIIKEGVFADLFIKPFPCDVTRREVRMLTGKMDCDDIHE